MNKSGEGDAQSPNQKRSGSLKINIKVKLNRESQMAFTLLLISGFHLIIHLASAIDFALLYCGIAFDFSKSTMRMIEAGEEVTDALSILIRIWNFYALFVTIPSFRSAILEFITCRIWPKAHGSINIEKRDSSQKTHRSSRLDQLAPSANELIGKSPVDNCL